MNSDQLEEELYFFLKKELANIKNINEEHKKTFDLLQPLVKNGNAAAELELGMLYRFGRGVTQDNDQALDLITKSANQGYTSAEFCLGYMYHHGQSVDINIEEAAKWYRRAAKKGHKLAQDMLNRVEFKN